MAGQGVRTPSSKRFHIVLIPGFAGFDALGQLNTSAVPNTNPFFPINGSDWLRLRAARPKWLEPVSTFKRRGLRC